MHHAQIRPDEEREWPPTRSRVRGAARVALVDVAQLDAQAVTDAGAEPQRILPKDRRRPGMY